MSKEKELGKPEKTVEEILTDQEKQAFAALCDAAVKNAGVSNGAAALTNVIYFYNKFNIPLAGK